MEGSGLANGVRAASDPDNYRDGAEERLLTVSASVTEKRSWITLYN